MQVFRLVVPGVVDRVIAFDELPKELLENVRTRPPEGMPRHWVRFLNDNGSVCDIVRRYSERRPDGTWMDIARTEVIGEGPCFFFLEYKDINSDKEKWQEITQFIRRSVSPTVRLLDKIEEMAKPLAKDAHSELSLEPDDIVVIPILKLDTVGVESKDGDSLRSNEDSITEQPRRRGRPRKAPMEQ